MVQGGDPLTKDPAKRAQYGTGGLNAVKAEARAPKMTRGSVAAVLDSRASPTAPARSSSSSLADQPALDGQYTVFGHVSDGIEVAAEDLGDAGRRRRASRPSASRSRTSRSAIRRRSRSSPRRRRSSAPIARCSTRAPGRSRSSSSGQGARTPCASSCAWPQAGVYNGMAFHRVAPGFVIQTGALSAATGAADREAADAGAQPAAGVQRHEAREGHRVDGARRRAGQRDDVVLHLHRRRRRRSTACTRRSAGSSTAWRPSRRSRRRRATARRRRRGSSCEACGSRRTVASGSAGVARRRSDATSDDA